MRKAGYIALFFFGLTACKTAGEKPLPVPVMKALIWDMMLADEWYGYISAKDSLGKFKNDNFRMYEKVFSIHGVKKETFYSSYKYYEGHPEQMKVLIDSIEHFSSRERTRIAELKAAEQNKTKK